MLNRRLTGGLAWTGLILVLAVPSADIISANMGSAQTASVIDPIQTASFTAGKDPVSDFLTTGKPLPSYISDPEVSAQPKRTT